MTYQTPPRILIVDDDEFICKTLSAILQSEGYQTTTATTAKEAVEKTKNHFFDIALLDIKLPDLEGTKLLAQMQLTTPETVKIMVTGYPSLRNAVEALNFGADSYIMKPLDPADLLKTIEEKLESRHQKEKMTKEKLAKWILSRARNTRLSNFQELLEEVSTELADFGLTKTQAKICVALIALGVASISEIAALSKVRREEVYRTIPEMEKRGVIARKLGVPQRFAAIPPETMIDILTKTKMKAMQEEIQKLSEKRSKLLSQLKPMELPIAKESHSIEVISKQDSAFAKLAEMTKNATKQIDIIAPLQNLYLVYTNRPKHLMDRVLKFMKMRIITDSHEIDMVTKEIIKLSQTKRNPVELRQIDKLPFNLLITDEKEAMWGENSTNEENTPVFWTDDPMQITILKTSFETLWQKSRERDLR